MLSKKNLFILIITCSYIACKPSVSDRTPLDDFKSISSQDLVGTSVKLSADSILLDPRTIMVFDSLAIIGDNNGIMAFSLIDLNNGKLIKRFASSGNDDRSFNINSVNISRIDGPKNAFSIYQNAEPHRLFVYSLDSLAIQQTYHPPYFYKLPSSFNYAAVLVKDSKTLLGRIDFSTFDQKMFGLLDVESEKLTTSLELPKNNENANAPYYTKSNIPWTKNVLGGSLVQRPGKNDFAYFSEKGSLMQLFTVDNQARFRLIFQKLYSLPTFRIITQGGNFTTAKLTQECKYGFNDITVTNDKIYALYNGRNTETNEIDSVSSKTVLVYNWNGKPERRINLDRSCFKISIDPKQPDILYGLMSFKHPGIIKYQLPK